MVNINCKWGFMPREKKWSEKTPKQDEGYTGGLEGKSVRDKYIDKLIKLQNEDKTATFAILQELYEITKLQNEDKTAAFTLYKMYDEHNVIFEVKKNPGSYMHNLNILAGRQLLTYEEKGEKLNIIIPKEVLSLAKSIVTENGISTFNVIKARASAPEIK